MREYVRVSWRHPWNYVFVAAAIVGIYLWLARAINGALVFAGLLAWVIAGRVFFPSIIHEHIGFLDRWLFHDYRKATQRYRKAVDTGKATAQAYASLGSLALAEGDLGESLRLLREALARMPEDAQVRALLARVLAARGRPEEAIEILNAATERVRDARVYAALGDVLKMRGDLEAAGAAYQASIRSFPRQAKSRIGLAQVYMSRAEYDEARRELELALTLEPDNTDCLYWMARVLIARGDFEGARRFLGRALQICNLDDHSGEVAYKELVVVFASLPRPSG